MHIYPSAFHILMIISDIHLNPLGWTAAVGEGGRTGEVVAVVLDNLPLDDGVAVTGGVAGPLAPESAEGAVLDHVLEVGDAAVLHAVLHGMVRQQGWHRVPRGAALDGPLLPRCLQNVSLLVHAAGLGEPCPRCCVGYVSLVGHATAQDGRRLSRGGRKRDMGLFGHAAAPDEPTTDILVVGVSTGIFIVRRELQSPQLVQTRIQQRAEGDVDDILAVVPSGSGGAGILGGLVAGGQMGAAVTAELATDGRSGWPGG